MAATIPISTNQHRVELGCEAGSAGSAGWVGGRVGPAVRTLASRRGSHAFGSTSCSASTSRDADAITRPLVDRQYRASCAGACACTHRHHATHARPRMLKKHYNTSGAPACRACQHDPWAWVSPMGAAVVRTGQARLGVKWGPRAHHGGDGGRVRVVSAAELRVARAVQHQLPAGLRCDAQAGCAQACAHVHACMHLGPRSSQLHERSRRRAHACRGPNRLMRALALAQAHACQARTVQAS